MSMEDPVQYINITFKGMEMGFNIAGRSIDQMLKILQMLVRGINYGIHHKDRQIEREMKRLNLEIDRKKKEMSVPLIGAADIQDLHQHFGNNREMISIPADKINEFCQKAVTYGCAFSEIADLDAYNNKKEFIIPGEQKNLYLQIINELNDASLDGISEQRKTVMKNINHFEELSLAAKKKILEIEKQLDDPEISENEAALLRSNLKTLAGQNDSYKREIATMQKHLKALDNGLASMISVEDYVNTAGLRSKESYDYEEGLDVPNGKGIRLDDFITAGFALEKREKGTDYLLNVGCRDISIHRELIHKEGKPEYHYSIYDGDDKKGSELVVDDKTSNIDLQKFKADVERIVQEKIWTLQNSPEISKEFHFNETDCQLYENIENMEILKKKQNNFHDVIHNYTPSLSGSKKLTESDLTAAWDDMASRKRMEELNTNYTYVPVSQIKPIEAEDSPTKKQGYMIDLENGSKVFFNINDCHSMKMQFTEDDQFAVFEVPTAPADATKNMDAGKALVIRNETQRLQSIAKIFKIMDSSPANQVCQNRYNGTYLSDAQDAIRETVKDMGEQAAEVLSSAAKTVRK